MSFFVMYIVYNCGYRLKLSLIGKATKAKYLFKKRFVTLVDNRDSQQFLDMTSKDIAWCPQTDIDLSPFMEIEDWCNSVQKRAAGPRIVYNPETYRKKFLLS